MMLVTLAWKEFREHRAIWLMMVVMTCGLGMGLAEIVAPGDPAMALAVASLSILGMAGAYGVVCGAMMLAGEHESGTLVFLDIFLGRRHLLWLGKWCIGLGLAATEALAVGGVLCFFKQMPPSWAPALIGLGSSAVPMPAAGHADWGPVLWLVVLPVITVEAFAWGLFGSALTRRVLSAAAVAALVATPVWLFAVVMPAPAFLVIRLTAAFIVLCVSYAVFFAQARETSLVLAAQPAEAADPRRRFMELWTEYEQQDRAERGAAIDDVDTLGEEVPVLEPIEVAPLAQRQPEPIAVAEPRKGRRRLRQCTATEALLWLTFQQARDLWLILAGVALIVGLFIPVHGEVLWPIATLLVGVACGVAVFAPEQRDLSYQFLAAQHLPLPSIWCFKIGFWLLAAMLLTLILVFSGMVAVLGRFVLTPRNQAGQVPLDFQLGTLREVLGPMVFFGVWLAYGFCSGQIVVWLCRKTILAVLLGLLAGGAVLGLWLPSLLCRGMPGWPLWLPPLVILAATQSADPCLGRRTHQGTQTARRADRLHDGGGGMGRAEPGLSRRGGAQRWPAARPDRVSRQHPRRRGQPRRHQDSGGSCAVRPAPAPIPSGASASPRPPSCRPASSKRRVPTAYRRCCGISRRASAWPPSSAISPTKASVAPPSTASPRCWRCCGVCATRRPSPAT